MPKGTREPGSLNVQAYVKGTKLAAIVRMLEKKGIDLDGRWSQLVHVLVEEFLVAHMVEELETLDEAVEVLRMRGFSTVQLLDLARNQSYRKGLAIENIAAERREETKDKRFEDIHSRWVRSEDLSKEEEEYLEQKLRENRNTHKARTESIGQSVESKKPQRSMDEIEAERKAKIAEQDAALVDVPSFGPEE